MGIGTVIETALFITIFSSFFYKQFSVLITTYTKAETEESNVGLALKLMLLIAFLSWYYHAFYEFVAEKPGVTPLMFVIALGLARYKHRDLFKDDDNPEEPLDPEPVA